MKNLNQSQLIKRAQSILEQNRAAGYTKPSARLYPFQWSWDSAFIAIGYAHFDEQKAQEELLSLFKGQWRNGMLPHIVFHQKKGKYFPGPDFWQTDLHPEATRKPATSGIIQPPLHATAALHIYRFAREPAKVRHFLQVIFPRLTQWHEYLHRFRGGETDGLLYICHPWESGQDNSPIWDDSLRQINPNKNELPPYKRVDNQLIASDERPDDRTYDRYVYLIELFKAAKYDDRVIRRECPFIIRDVLFNSLYCRANEDLAEIARIIGEDARPYQERAEQIRKALNEHLWDANHAIYVNYDVVAKSAIDIHVASGFLPLFAGIPSQTRAAEMFDYLNTSCFCRLSDECYAVPSFDKCHPDFSPKEYWRGPIWININWLLCEGLMKYGFDDYVRRVAHSIIDLPAHYGFYEYFDPQKGCGLGSADFSWTAALFLDKIYHQADS